MSPRNRFRIRALHSAALSPFYCRCKTQNTDLRFPRSSCARRFSWECQSHLFIFSAEFSPALWQAFFPRALHGVRVVNQWKRASHRVVFYTGLIFALKQQFDLFFFFFFLFAKRSCPNRVNFARESSLNRFDLADVRLTTSNFPRSFEYLFCEKFPKAKLLCIG